jgi:hypothetical protein
MSDAPALRYYRALVGAWRGRFSFEVTDPRALRSEPLAVRLRVRSYALAQRLGGPDWMSTTLAAAPEGPGAAFVHTTRVHRLGVTLFSGSERFALEEGGRTFAVTGTQRSWPALGAGERYSGDGEIDAAATGATYRLRWLGAALLQTTAIVPEGLLLTQETRWSRAQVLLVRR